MRRIGKRPPFDTIRDRVRAGRDFGHDRAAERAGRGPGCHTDMPFERGRDGSGRRRPPRGAHSRATDGSLLQGAGGRARAAPARRLAPRRLRRGPCQRRQSDRQLFRRASRHRPGRHGQRRKAGPWGHAVGPGARSRVRPAARDGPLRRDRWPRCAGPVWHACRGRDQPHAALHGRGGRHARRGILACLESGRRSHRARHHLRAGRYGRLASRAADALGPASGFLPDLQDGPRLRHGA
jgi:hypothetical protein